VTRRLQKKTESQSTVWF